MQAAAKKRLSFKSYDSTNVASAAFDSDRKVIIVRFTGGGQYEYAGCDERLWKDMNKAKSVGSFVSQQLKPSKECTQIENWK